MIAKTRAIVLRNTNYSESSVITKMLTREFGIRSYIIQGVKKGKSAIRPAMIQPLSLLEMEVYEKSNSNINRIKELKNTPFLHSIQDNMLKKSVAMFLVELLNQCITEELCEEELFDFLWDQVHELENNELNPLYPVLFLVDFTDFFGLKPQGVYSSNTPYFSIEDGVFTAEVEINSMSQKCSQALSSIIQTRGMSGMGGTVRRDLISELIKYYQYHITKGKRIKSVEILSELFS